LTIIARLFFPITIKIKDHPPSPNLTICFSNGIPYIKLGVIFEMQWHGGNIKNATALAVFIFRVALQSENHAVQKILTAIVRATLGAHSSNYSPHSMVSVCLVLYVPFALSMQGVTTRYCQATHSFKKNTNFHLIHEVC
jgi:hypothetical protein